MTDPRRIERLAVASLATGLLLFLAVLAFAVVPPGWRSARTFGPARDALRCAEVLRTETVDADDRFDTVMAGLVADVNLSAPGVLAPELDLVDTARALERTLGRRTDATQRAIGGALARASARLAAIENGRPVIGYALGTTRSTAALAALLVSAVLLPSGSALALSALRSRRRELALIATRLQLPLAHACDGTLVDDVTILTLRRRRTPVGERTPAPPAARPLERVPRMPDTPTGAAT